MSAFTPTMHAFASTSTGARWSGRILSGLVIAFLLLDGAIKLVPLPEVTATLTQLGFQPSDALARGIGVLTLACALLYAWPRTSVVGAILTTGLLGGAMATHLRAGSPVFSHFLFGAYIGLMAWGGLWLRDVRVRAWLGGRGGPADAPR